MQWPRERRPLGRGREGRPSPQNLYERRDNLGDADRADLVIPFIIRSASSRAIGRATFRYFDAVVRAIPSPRNESEDRPGRGHSSGDGRLVRISDFVSPDGRATRHKAQVASAALGGSLTAGGVASVLRLGGITVRSVDHPLRLT
jgi:hypothetical protein